MRPHLKKSREKNQNREAILNFFEFVAMEAVHRCYTRAGPWGGSITCWNSKRLWTLPGAFQGDAGDQPPEQRTRKNSKSLRDFEFFLAESLIEGPSTTEPSRGAAWLGVIWTHMGGTWGRFGSIWGSFGPSEGSSGDDLGAHGAHQGPPGGPGRAPGGPCGPDVDFSLVL